MSRDQITRRALLATLAAPALAQERKLRIGIVGGHFGATFQFHGHPNCIVEAVSDLREDRRAHLANTYSCGKTYASLKEKPWPTRYRESSRTNPPFAAACK